MFKHSQVGSYQLSPLPKKSPRCHNLSHSVYSTARCFSYLQPSSLRAPVRLLLPLAMTPSRSRSNSNAYQQNNRSYTPNVSRVAHKQRTQRSTNAAVLTSPVPVHSSKPPHSNRISTPRKTPIPPADVGMSPASRYNSNLRVLRRRDHTIVSVFDQFPHVCMYHHNKAAGKWEKKGYEGTFFLFERYLFRVRAYFGLFSYLTQQGNRTKIWVLYP